MPENRLALLAHFVKFRRLARRREIMNEKITVNKKPEPEQASMSTASSLIGLVIWVALSFGAAWFGSQFEPGAWFEQLQKPAWNPPNWLFAPVWSVLYALMGIAAWLIWKNKGFAGAALPLTLFLIQLVLNAAWSWLFFGLHTLGLAFGEIVLLWLAILATLILFWRERPVAGALFIPYLAWVTFAAALNFTIWQLNS
jgi:tryptophan-rich sensory protein